MLSPALTMNCTGIDKKLIIETEFNDTLSSSSCTILISEIIKYILYHKQQLPYTFDRLKYVITKRRATQAVKNNKTTAFTNSERLFKIAEEGFTVLEALFEKTKQEILNSNKVNEIVLLFGSSPLTPSQVYHIHLPKLYCNHQLRSHSERKYLLQFLQSAIESSKLNEMLMKPMAPTNMYVFIRKDTSICSEDNIGSWFLPKNRFQIPTNGQHFHLKLIHPLYENRTCACKSFNIYSDSIEEVLPRHSASSIQIKENSDSPSNRHETRTEWYQACATFKGFKDAYVNGVSVSDTWMR